MKVDDERASFARLFAVLAGSAVLALAPASFAQEDESGEAAEEEQAEASVETIVVTGSRIKRAELDGPSPVQIITADDLEAEGFTTVYDALNTLTQFTGSVQNELFQNGFTPNANFLNLRGLGPGYQLVLINGHRVADYPLPYNSQSNAVNLANIPSAAIERIEVLAGGASAIYGSDAVAGVVNIILRSDYEGDEFKLRGGTSTRGGGEVGQLTWVGGKTGDAWNITYAFEYLEREPIFASERDFMDSYLDDPTVDDPADVNPVEGLLLIDAINSNRIFSGGTGQEVCGQFSEFEIFFFETSSVYTGPRCGYFGYPATQAIRNADSNLSGYLFGDYDFANGMEGYGQLLFTQAEAELASNTQFWSSPIFFDPNLSSAALPFGAFVQTQRIFTPAEVGGLNAQKTIIEEQSMDFLAGVRGTVFDDRFDWDASVSYARYDLVSDRPRFLANELTDFFLGEQLGIDPFFGQFPVFDLNDANYFTPTDPATFQSLNTTVHAEAESQVTQGQFVLSGDLFELPAGPLGMAMVLEMAAQEYEIIPDERTSPTYTGPEPIYNLTSTGGGGDRDRIATGLEFSVPIVESVNLSLAGRYDKYDDITQVDDAITWQAGLEWRPVDSLLLRASHGTSFRAPDMHYIFADTSGFFQTVFDEYRCRRDGFDVDDEICDTAEYVYSVFGVRHGSSELEEEEGESTTFGFVWEPIDDMSLTADYYRIELKGAVSDISTGYLMRNEADCRLGQERDGSAVDPNSAGCQFFTGLIDRLAVDAVNDGEIDQFESLPFNQSYVETSGIDATWRYQIDTDRLGNFGLEVAWTHVLEKNFQEFPGDELVNRRDHKQFFDFRSRITGQLNWQRDDWGATVYAYRWGSLPNWAETGRISPYFQWNVNGYKDFGENMRLSLYVNNVFDDIHPGDDTFFTYPFFWRAFSPVGRTVFAEFTYRIN